MTPVLLAHLYAMRAHLDALILLAETDLGVAPTATAEPGGCPVCGASPEQVQDTSTLDGTKRSRCAACGEEWER